MVADFFQMLPAHLQKENVAILKLAHIFKKKINMYVEKIVNVSIKLIVMASKLHVQNLNQKLMEFFAKILLNLFLNFKYYIHER